MDKLAIKLLVEIFVITILISFSIPSWNDIQASTSNLDEKIASLEQRLEIYAINKNEVSMVTENSDFKTKNVIVYNNSNIKRNGNLLLQYSKLSTLDYNHLIVTVNNIDYDLCLLLLTVTKDYYVFTIEKVTLEKYSSQEYSIGYNVKEGVLFDQILGKYFDSNIEIIEY